jgi:hypothetical protein
MGRGLPTLGEQPKAKRKGRSAAQVCTSAGGVPGGWTLPAGVTSAEDWGSPCDARGAGPLVSLSSFGVRGSAHASQDGRCGREQPAEEGGGGRRRSVAREDASALTMRMLSQSRSCLNSVNKLSTGPFQNERRLAHTASVVTWRQTLE